MESTQYPELRSIPPAEKEAFFERTAAVPCPALEEDGRCRIYDSRPLVCRTFGLPIRDGAQYIGDICELNFTEASQEVREEAAWDLQNEDELGPEDEYTVPEAIVIAARLLKTRRR
jgi:Fe-S-cluster containining protein